MHDYNVKSSQKGKIVSSEVEKFCSTSCAVEMNNILQKKCQIAFVEGCEL